MLNFVALVLRLLPGNELLETLAHPSPEAESKGIAFGGKTKGTRRREGSRIGVISLTAIAR
jgi:hypothetical protein